VGQFARGLSAFITMAVSFLMAFLMVMLGVGLYISEYPPVVFGIAFIVAGIFFLGGLATSNIDVSPAEQKAYKNIIQERYGEQSQPIQPQNKEANISSEILPILPDDHPVNSDTSDSNCPYCGCSMDWKKKPSRRSQFACKHCGETINHETEPLLYSGSYLTDDQLGLDGIAEQLHHWCFTGITETTIPNVRRKLKKSGVEPVPTTMVCSLLIQAMEYAEKQKKREIQEIKKTFRGDQQSIKEMTRDAIECSPEIDDINGLMKEYCEFIEDLVKIKP
jgi:transposase-like protein